MSPAQIATQTRHIGALHAESFHRWQLRQVRRFGLPDARATAEGLSDRYNPGFSPEGRERENAKRAREAASDDPARDAGKRREARAPA